jgi:hypothetical protein
MTILKGFISLKEPLDSQQQLIGIDLLAVDRQLVVFC